MSGVRPRRACLSVPGSSERMLAKARTLDVDEVVLDLEDAVPAGGKDAARARVAEALAAGGWVARSVAVRVNAPATAWCHLDLQAIAGAPALGSVVVPKVGGARDLAFVEHLLDGIELAAGRLEPVGVQALIETAGGLLAVAEIAAASRRLEALILGYADLGASLGRSRAADPSTWLPAQHAVLVAARAHGRQAIDGPELEVAVDESFAAAADRARQLGFDGKWAIHPDQAAALMDRFTPSDEEISHARAVLDALDSASARGAGAVTVDGAMVDEAMRSAALRTLAARS